MTTNAHVHTVPNHHAHHTGFAGVSGFLAAMSMTIGRTANADFAIDLAQLDATDRVVDIGCGPGTAARRAARVGARVTGVDPAGVMLRVARLLSVGKGVPYLEGAAESLPLPDASATVVWTIASVHHWPDLDAGVAEVRRVLEPGGRFVVIEHQAQLGATGLASHGWTDDQAEVFASRCRTAGFVDVRIARSDAGRRGAIAVVAVQLSTRTTSDG